MPGSPSNSTLSMRAARDADFETLYAIDQDCFPRGIAYSRRMLRWFLSLPGADCLVAEEGKQMLGFILAHVEGREGQIVTLDVLPLYRRSGLGSALLERAESRLAAHGVRVVTLETATTNDAAVAFWQKHGYRTEAVLRNYYMGKLDAFQMRKALSSSKQTPPPAPEAR